MDYKILLEFKPKVNERGVFLRDAHYFVTKYPCINNDHNDGFIMRYFKLKEHSTLVECLTMSYTLRIFCSLAFCHVG